MGCTCRSPARCPSCNRPVLVPLTNLESASGATMIGERLARRDSGSSAGLRRLIQGATSCPNCGSPVQVEHSRSCVSRALASAGVPSTEREALLAKMTFPEA